MRSGQASKVQDALRGIYNILPESIQMPFTGVINAITPRLIAVLDKLDLNTERIKSALINANLQNRAAVVVNNIRAETGSSKQWFGNSINGSIITLDSATGATVKRVLIDRYREMTDLTPSQIDEALEGAADFKFHESDLINAVVEVKTTRNAKGIVEIEFGLDKRFKEPGNPFWETVTLPDGKKVGRMTHQGHYLTQRAKAYGEFAKLLDESGIPIGVTADGAEIMLRGVDRVKQLLTDGAFVSRFVWSKTNGVRRGNPDATFEKYYNKARTLLDPDELLTAVDSGRIAYATPEDTLAVYASGVYKQIADTALEERLIKLFSDPNNKAFADKYEVRVVRDLKNVLDSGEEKAFRGIGKADPLTGGRETKRVAYKKLEDTGEVIPTTTTDRQRLFDGLVFTDDHAAARFAKDFDVLLKNEEGFFGLLKRWMVTSKTARTAADISRIFRLAGTGIDVGLLAIYGPVVTVSYTHLTLPTIYSV